MSIVPQQPNESIEGLARGIRNKSYFPERTWTDLKQQGMNPNTALTRLINSLSGARNLPANILECKTQLQEKGTVTITNIYSLSRLGLDIQITKNAPEDSSKQRISPIYGIFDTSYLELIAKIHYHIQNIDSITKLTTYFVGTNFSPGEFVTKKIPLMALHKDLCLGVPSTEVGLGILLGHMHKNQSDQLYLPTDTIYTDGYLLYPKTYLDLLADHIDHILNT